MIKSANELDRMRAAARAIEAGMDAALHTIAPGKTDNDLAAALYQGSIAAGSEYIGHPPMVVAGPRSELCFALWKRNTIQKGDVVLLEGAGCIDRYHAMMSRSAVVGKATDEHKATADALIEILETAIETIRPGITSGEVDFACRSKVEKRGLGRYFKSRTAYGIGIGFPPNWAEGHLYSLRPDDPMVLQPDMTFHVIPTMFRKGFGMAISDSIRVTQNGCEVLTNYPRHLIEVEV
jgi:Xaa-Pro dipeptidase